MLAVIWGEKSRKNWVKKTETLSATTFSGAEIGWNDGLAFRTVCWFAGVKIWLLLTLCFELYFIYLWGIIFREFGMK